MEAQCEKLITNSLGNVFLSGGKRLPSRMMKISFELRVTRDKMARQAKAPAAAEALADRRKHERDKLSGK